MTPPLMERNVIATNLQILLNAALRDYDESRYAVQRPGLECPWPRGILAGMDRIGAYKPELDVAVVDDDVVQGRRFTDKAYLLAEAVSSTDEDLTPVGGERWIDVKVSLSGARPLLGHRRRGAGARARDGPDPGARRLDEPGPVRPRRRLRRSLGRPRLQGGGSRPGYALASASVPRPPAPIARLTARHPGDARAV